MAFDVQSQKVTWGALWVLAGLVFSSGIGWNQLKDAIETNATQWRFINKNTSDISHQEIYLRKVDSIADSLAARSQSEKDLTIAVTKLTVAVDNIFDKAKVDREDKLKADQFMMELSRKISNIEVKVGKIESKLTK